MPNRFASQAVIGHPLAMCGGGSQARGIIGIWDTVRCIQLACENPVNRGEFPGFRPGTVRAACRGDVTTENLGNLGRGARGASRRLSADPNLTRAIRQGGECHLESE